MRRDDYQHETEWAAFEAALRTVPAPAPGPELSARCLPGGAEADPELHRVLVVDDEPHLRRLVEVQMLRGGYAVRTAGGGEECLAVLAEWRPAVVILDVMMPGMSGFEVLHAIKSDPATADVLVVMLTARAEYDSIRHGWDTGADFYMGKPFNPEELRVVVDRLTALLGTPDNPPPLRRWSKWKEEP